MRAYLSRISFKQREEASLAVLIEDKGENWKRNCQSRCQGKLLKHEYTNCNYMH